MEWLKQGAAVITAVIAAIGVGSAIIYFLWMEQLTADQALPILTGLLFGATGFLWGRASAQGAVRDFQEGLHTNVTNGTGAGDADDEPVPPTP